MKPFGSGMEKKSASTIRCLSGRPKVSATLAVS